MTTILASALFALSVQLHAAADAPILDLPDQPGRIALRAADPDEAARLLHLMTGHRAHCEPVGPHGWYVAIFPQAMNMDVTDVLAKVVAEDGHGIAYAAPVKTGLAGTLVIPSSDILLRSSSVSSRERAATIASACGQVERIDGWGGLPEVSCLRVATRDGSAVLKLIEELARLPDVQWVEPDCLFGGRAAAIEVNDPSFIQCWGLHNVGQLGGVPDVDMDALEAWSLTIGDPGVIVGIIDTGVDPLHVDLNQAPGVDVTADPNAAGGAPVNACDNHGTLVAGCVSAILNNGLGGCGVSPGARVASIRTMVANASCNGSWSSMSSFTVAALDWALANGVRVTCNSNFYGFQSNAIADKYQQTWAAGIVHFASTGNFGGTQIVYPASIPVVNSVTAINDDGLLPAFASTGKGLDFSAPGVEIFTTDRTGAAGVNSGDFAVVKGTSFSTPYAAGVAALVISARPDLSAAEVEAILQQSTVDFGVPGYDTSFGYGVVNALNALLAALPSGDLNGDGVVDGADLGLLLGAWDGADPIADLNGDGVVDGADLGLLLGSWS